MSAAPEIVRAEPVASSSSAATSAERDVIEVPEGASCAVHPGVDARFVCQRCGSFGCGECRFAEVHRKTTCRACADKGLGEPIPWERAQEIGWWRAFWDTVSLATRSPTRFFRTPTTKESVFSAIAHAVLTSTVGLLLSYLAAGALALLGGGTLAALAPSEPSVDLGTGLAVWGCVIAGMSPLALLAGPANAMLGVVYASAAAHATLALFKRARGSFEDTLRAVSYANAPYVWQWVPVLGAFSWFWMIGVEAIAIRETHRCGTDWAVGAVLVHRIVFGLAILAAYAMVGLGMWALIIADQAAAAGP